MSARTADLIERLRQMGEDIEYVRTDDLGDHWVQWVEREAKDGGPAGIWFYADEINGKVVVEHIGQACNAVEPNQSAANAAVCNSPSGHKGWHEGYAQGPAAAERPGRHCWLLVGSGQ